MVCSGWSVTTNEARAQLLDVQHRRARRWLISGLTQRVLARPVRTSSAACVSTMRVTSSPTLLDMSAPCGHVREENGSAKRTRGDGVKEQALLTRLAISTGSALSSCSFATMLRTTAFACAQSNLLRATVLSTMM